MITENQDVIIHCPHNLYVIYAPSLQHFIDLMREC